MTVKIWGWIFFIITIIGWSVFFFVDLYYYANVMDLGFFIPVLAVQLYMGISAVIRDKKVFLYVGFLMMFCAILYFFITVPACTYKEAQQSVMDDYQSNQVKLLPLDHKTVPSDRSSWFLPDKMYYVAVMDKENNGQIDYYSVDLVRGDAMKLEGPYW